jgi:hypothetical protein
VFVVDLFAGCYHRRSCPDASDRVDAVEHQASLRHRHRA